MDEYEDFGGIQRAAQKMSSGDGGQIPMELERQGVTIQELHEIIGSLEARLAPVRLAKPENPSAERDVPESVKADVANVIAQLTSEIGRAHRRLQTILHELEL